ncbi:HD-GYP domain-containing protein [Alkaliphilus serpentinus]|uniref:HD-GYP domain-containing protein n=1 Tax=Alkaliphilus serpentinus TaxID=1482731 RepID=A0A833M8A9_9FIRM|nr:HD-GYP domain-containing protein [Alkaliphilus serpentinus]KAB3524830.1 HD-GYP domain-containing protein [Alkaliphilus serpentinus]
MKKLYLSQIKDGSPIPMDLYNCNGAVLIKKGTEMTDILRRKLLRNNIDYFITDIAIFEPDINKLYDVDDILLREVEELQKVYKVSFDEFSNQMESLKKNHTLDKGTLDDISNNLIQCITEHKQVYIGIQGIRRKDFYTYIHSIDVAIFAIIMGESLGLSKRNLKKLALSALLHDVGKIEIDDEILSKPTSLTEDEMNKMKMHTIYGYEIIKDKLGYFEEIAMVALEHHEKVDGSGYPKAAEKKNIHFFSQIVAICDIYDAITADRVYRKGVLPHRGVEYLMSVTNSHIDHELTRKFIGNIAVYPLGTQVGLNNGEEGIVIHLHKGFPLRPVVRIKGSNIKRDLMKELTLFVKEVIEN